MTKEQIELRRIENLLSDVSDYYDKSPYKELFSLSKLNNKICSLEKQGVKLEKLILGDAFKPINDEGEFSASFTYYHNLDHALEKGYFVSED